MLAVPCSCAITYTLRMADSADLKDRLEDFLGRELGAPVSVTDLVRLPGGASRETWSLTASGPAGEMRLVPITADPLSQQGSNLQADAPACDVCGSITVRSGTCYKCLNCGNSMGCS